MFTIEYDEAAGFVRCRSEGFFTEAEVRMHAAQAKAAVDRCRDVNGDVKILIVSGPDIQKTEVMAVAQAERRTARGGPYDRRAFVLPSSLLKLQVSRIFDSELEKCFISENAAVTWLLADRAGRKAEIARPLQSSAAA